RYCKFCGAPLDEAAARDDAAPQPPREEPAPPVAAFGANGQSRESAPPPLRTAARESVPAPPLQAPPLPKPERAGPTEPGRQHPARANQPVVPVTREIGRLIIITEDGTEGRSYPIVTPQTDIGRVEGEVLLKEDAYVSPRHARLLATKEGLV